MNPLIGKGFIDRLNQLIRFLRRNITGTVIRNNQIFLVPLSRKGNQVDAERHIRVRHINTDAGRFQR